MTTLKMLFLNHASVLINKGDEYILCDPWFEKPAFGSWLPNPPLFIHPAYLTALKDKLTILISHAHDDHCDHDFLNLFDKNTKIISSDYDSSSVMRRMKQCGFENYEDVSSNGIQVGSFFIKSFRNEDYSLDDALYTIRCDDGLIIHGNDNWRKFPDETIAIIREEVDIAGGDKTIYMSQTNIASGFPLIFNDFSDEEKMLLLKHHVAEVITSGIENGEKVGAKYFHTYAGFAQSFVKGKESYLKTSIYPSPKYINENLPQETLNKIKVLDLYPGDTVNFKDMSVIQSFFGRDIFDNPIREASQKYYVDYNKVNQGDSYKDFSKLSDENLPLQLEHFLNGFNNFVVRKVDKSEFYPSIIGKTFSIEINELNLTKSIRFGEGIIESNYYNKKLILDKNIIKGVLLGEILFESITTGYLGEVSRNPREVYNRDIYLYITMYSYFYINVILRNFIKT